MSIHCISFEILSMALLPPKIEAMIIIHLNGPYICIDNIDEA